MFKRLQPDDTLNRDEFLNKLEERRPNEYKIISKFEGMYRKISFKHSCGEEGEALPINMLKPSFECEKCFKLITDEETFLNLLPENIQDNYYFSFDEEHMIGDLIEICCQGCQRTYHRTPNSFVRYPHCLPCKLRKTNEVFLNEVNKLVGDEYTFLTKYKKSDVKLKCKHNTCGEMFYISPSSFLQGTGCPRCRESKGERRVRNHLESLGVKFSKESYMGKTKKRFDFYVKSKIYIEYDGGQHFFPVDFAGKGEGWSTKEMTKNQVHDTAKNQYSIKKSIPLIRIPYWEFNNIESILTAALSHFNIIEHNNDYDKSFLEWLVDDNWDHDAYIAKCPKNMKKAETELKTELVVS